MTKVFTRDLRAIPAPHLPLEQEYILAALPCQLVPQLHYEIVEDSVFFWWSSLECQGSRERHSLILFVLVHALGLVVDSIVEEDATHVVEERGLIVLLQAGPIGS